MLNIPYKTASSSTTQRYPSLYLEIRKDFLKGELLEEVLDCHMMLFIQASIMYVVFSSWLTLKRHLTVGVWSFIKKLIKFHLGSSITRRIEIFIVTFSLVCQLMDSVLNGFMYKEVHDRVIPYRHICFLYVPKLYSL